MSRCRRARLVALLALALAACAPDGPEPVVTGACAGRPEGDLRVDRVVLVTLDGVRWQEIASGVDRRFGRGLPPKKARALMPSLYRLIDSGAGFVEGMRTSAPRPVSLPGYREILTGRVSRRCRDNNCPPIDEPTLLDELFGAGVPPYEIALLASWELLDRAATAKPESAMVSSGRRRDPAARVEYRTDAETASLALDYLVQARPRFLHVALGDTDREAHAGRYAGYIAALEAADAFLARLRATLEALGGESVIVVTTDHGRGPSFRHHGGERDGSDRVWLVASGGPIVPRGLIRPRGPRRLADIAPTLRLLLGLPADRSRAAGSALTELLVPGDS